MPQTYSPDGLLRFGDKIMLSNKATDACLVANIGEKIATYEEAYAVTSSPHISGPNARCIFLVERVNPADGYADNVVHYGQEVKFVTNPALHSRRLFLKSTPHSPLHHSKYSRFQEVCVTNMDSFDTVWTIEGIDPNTRFEAEGEPVLANAPLLVKHKSTCHFLASDKVDYKNDFGGEFEVTVHSYATKNKS